MAKPHLSQPLIITPSFSRATSSMSLIKEDIANIYFLCECCHSPKVLYRNAVNYNNGISARAGGSYPLELLCRGNGMALGDSRAKGRSYDFDPLLNDSLIMDLQCRMSSADSRSSLPGCSWFDWCIVHNPGCFHCCCCRFRCWNYAVGFVLQRDTARG